MPRILGLDIGPTVVRGTLCQTGLRRTEVLCYAEAPREQGAEAQDGSLREAVRGVMDQLPGSPDGVVAELDGREGAALRTLELPAGAAKRIGEVLPFELETLIPFAIEDSVIDYQIIERGPETLRLLATAAPKSKVASRLQELRDAGVDPRELAVGAAALDGLLPLLPELQGSATKVILDVEERSSDVCIVRNGRCETARTLSVGTQELRAGRSAALVAQLRHTLAGYRASGGPEPETIYLAGDAATYDNAISWLSEVAGTEAMVLPLPPAPGVEDAGRPCFARATALAGRVAARGKRLDLRQGEFARQRAAGTIRQHARMLAVCASIILVSFGFSSYARWTILKGEQAALQAKLGRVTKQFFDRKVARPEMARELLTGANGPQDPLPRFDAFDVLDLLSRHIPEEITHDTRRLRIDFDDKAKKGHLEIEGTVDSIAQRDTIAAQLERHECITKLDKGRTTPGPGNEGLSYQLEAEVNCPDTSGIGDSTRDRDGEEGS